MKLLHTGDWHLGHSIAGYDRSEEHAHTLDHIAEITLRHKPDVFLLCGDIFHTAQPSAAMQTLFTETIVKLRRLCPDMVIITIAGNHDSAAKHDIFRTPWKALGVHTFGSIDRDNPGAHIVEMPGKGFVAAIPYTHSRNMPADFFDSVAGEMSRINRESLPAVLMAHTTIAGCDFSGHENSSELTVGGLDAVSPDCLGHSYDYIALGHIHHPQTLPHSKPRARYAGSPMAVSFAEDYAHSVSIVEIEAGGVPPTVITEQIAPLRPMVTLPSSGFAPWSEASRLLKEFPPEIDAYIRLNISSDEPVPADAAAQAATICTGKLARFCRLNVQRDCTDSSEVPTMTINELRESSPIDIAARFASDSGIDFTDEMKEMFCLAASLADEQL